MSGSPFSVTSTDDTMMDVTTSLCGRGAAAPTTRSVSYYTDADFAMDMNALTPLQRQRVTEDIHNVTDVVDETPAFVASKLEEFQQVLENLTKRSHRRVAWDRAVFLRPSLNDIHQSQQHALLFLRAKRFDAYDAASLLFKFYEAKYALGGDAFLVQPTLRWNDLSPDDQAILYRGIGLYKTPRLGVGVCRRLRYDRCAMLDATVDPHAFVRSVLYTSLWNLQGGDDGIQFQKAGLMAIFDLRGHLSFTTMQLLEWLKVVVPLLETFPIHLGALHLLLERDDHNRAGVARALQSILNRVWRIRVRLHIGSWMEIQYSLRTYGIDIAGDWMTQGDNEPQQTNPFSTESIQAALQECLQKEDERQRLEEAFCSSNSEDSEFALYPQTLDVLLGKNRSVGPTWPGNLALNVLVEEWVNDYGSAANNEEKMVVVNHILQRLHQNGSRFVTRLDNGWKVVSEDEARKKISQALRDELRRMWKRTGS